MQVSPYIFFNGNCKEAFETYAKILGAEIEAMMPHAGTPAEQSVPSEWGEKIMHACMVVDGQRIMASDDPGMGSNKPRGFYVSLRYKDVDEGKRIFDALAEGGSVVMPFSPTFWSRGFGMVTDRFDIPWMINCDQ
jgi:PhnB protein